MSNFFTDWRDDPSPEAADTARSRIKPRPLRAAEVLWDMIPVIAVVALWFYFGAPYGWLGFLIGSAEATVVLPILASVWMQFSSGSLIVPLCRREWREALALTCLRPRDQLIPALQNRVWMQAVPFLIGLACSFVWAGVMLIWISREASVVEEVDLRLFVVGALYAIISLQHWSFCGGLLGLFNRIRLCCSRGESGSGMFLVSLKWVIVIVSMAGALVGGLTMLVFYDPPETADVFLYLLVAPTILNVLFHRALNLAWQRTQDAYYTFE